MQLGDGATKHPPVAGRAPTQTDRTVPPLGAAEGRAHSLSLARSIGDGPAAVERWRPGAPRHDAGPPPVFAAYYYPGWHASPGRSVRGERSEWALLYGDGTPYPDVRRPLGGPAPVTPEAFEAEAREAHAGGIDAFVWCWYWDRGRRTLGEALEMFLECSRPAGFRYAVAWV